jgi:hypothetical protein
VEVGPCMVEVQQRPMGRIQKVGAYLGVREQIMMRDPTVIKSGHNILQRAVVCRQEMVVEIEERR